MRVGSGIDTFQAAEPHCSVNDGPVKLNGKTSFDFNCSFFGEFITVPKVG